MVVDDAMSLYWRYSAIIRIHISIHIVLHACTPQRLLKVHASWNASNLECMQSSPPSLIVRATGSLLISPTQQPPIPSHHLHSTVPPVHPVPPAVHPALSAVHPVPPLCTLCIRVSVRPVVHPVSPAVHQCIRASVRQCIRASCCSKLSNGLVLNALQQYWIVVAPSLSNLQIWNIIGGY